MARGGSEQNDGAAAGMDAAGKELDGTAARDGEESSEGVGVQADEPAVVTSIGEHEEHSLDPTVTHLEGEAPLEGPDVGRPLLGLDADLPSADLEQDVPRPEIARDRQRSLRAPPQCRVGQGAQARQEPQVAASRTGSPAG